MKTLYKSFSIAALVLIAGCRKLDIAPTDAYSELNFWNTDANVYNALNNNYSLMYNSGLYFNAEALSDNAYSQTNADAIQIASGTANAQTPKFAGDWAYYYSTIKSCNQFLANVDKNTTLGATNLARLKAEVRFIRAFEDFNLTKWYGDVPLVNNDISQEEAKNIARTPKADVVNFILGELDAILPPLPSKDQLPAAENGRITKGAVLALKARVLLYQGNRMADVVTVCESLMSGANGTYSLNPNYSNLFSDPATNKNNPETILSLQYVPATTRTWSDYWDFAPNSVGGRVNAQAPTQELVNDYVMLNGKTITDPASGYDETNPYVNRDPRLTATIVYDRYNWNNGGGVNGTSKIIYIKPGSDPTRPGPDEYSSGRQSSSPTGYYWRKYFDPSALANFVSGNNLHLFRYAEILLDYAEAKNSLGQMDATVWNKTIGALRARAGFSDQAALNFPGGDLTNVIRRERRVELALEGLRIDDIRRWKIAENVLNGYVHGAKFSSDPATDNGYIRVQQRRFDPNRDYLWAIPSGDLSLDPKLTQNPGY
ncbi:RagB/SusD family nutrient uptake outer membrane protein [Mucilaginibacter sp. KACC 22063]|uniref:RagB/SusD family nutrient uptake outer membrane protein n=1 Tax=Mucilaginibacter sp. KACC 22063 TaxID=3025666 RepID=UPI002365B409|nr:RagB/SusD family nutrient uptake outer membrane protein [Mucilaginibacter sp. KACC 22063]WDF57323.1 RagB/SusD family nutrient uptake outer membrane protein [Mucilaginibacter sp. KACC 22063]